MKTKIIKFRCTPEFKRALEDKAATIGMTVSEYIRFVVAGIKDGAK